MPKTLDEVQSFMDSVRLASFASVNSKGEPHVVPVFFTYEHGRVYVQTDCESVKVKNLSWNCHVALAVYRGEEAVIVRGKGRIVKKDEEFMKRTHDHIEKYRLRLDKNGRDELGIPLFDKEIRCVIEVASTKMLYW